MSEAPDKLVIRRVGGELLHVTPRDGGWDIHVASSRAITQSEYDQITAYVGTGEASDAFLAKLRKQMGKA